LKSGTPEAILGAGIETRKRIVMFGFAAAAATARRLVSRPSFAVADVTAIPACGHLRHVDGCAACREYRQSRASPTSRDELTNR
jgi:hypothetical protein